LLGRRSFTHQAAQALASSGGHPHRFTSRADLGEYPELDRSFMKVLDSGIDTKSADYLDNYQAMLKQNAEL
jgi:hypothetical protein